MKNRGKFKDQLPEKQLPKNLEPRKDGLFSGWKIDELISDSQDENVNHADDGCDTAI